MYADQHLHTSFSGDSETPPEEQAEKAIALGMERICFTDHHDHDVVSDIDFELDIPRYMAAISELKKKYSGRLDIRTGIELGLQSHIADYLYKLTEEYPFEKKERFPPSTAVRNMNVNITAITDGSSLSAGEPRKRDAMYAPAQSTMNTASFNIEPSTNFPYFVSAICNTSHVTKKAFRGGAFHKLRNI